MTLEQLDRSLGTMWCEFIFRKKRKKIIEIKTGYLHMIYHMNFLLVKEQLDTRYTVSGLFLEKYLEKLERILLFINNWCFFI